MITKRAQSGSVSPAGAEPLHMFPRHTSNLLWADGHANWWPATEGYGYNDTLDWFPEQNSPNIVVSSCHPKD